MIEEELTNYEKEEQKRRKQEIIAYRNKKRFSSFFMTMACIFEILETMVIMFALLVISVLLVYRVFHLQDRAASIAMTIALVVIFIGGLILGFFIYKKAVIFVIKKGKLEDKLSDDILDHYTRNPWKPSEEKLRR